MPRNASGVYSLPVSAYISGTTIKSSDMNTNLSDIATALTQSLATTGISTMTGPVKAADGSAAAPAYTFGTETNLGFYRSAGGAVGFASGGILIVTLNASGITLSGTALYTDAVGGVVTARVIGEVIDYAGSTAPSRWLLCFGQAISRATYALLFAIVGITYGAGDGVTTFNLPDCRGRTTYGKDDMGGAAANRITVAGGNFDGTVLGGTGGLQNHTMVVGELVAHSHTVNITDPGHTHSLVFQLSNQQFASNVGGGATNIAINTTSPGTSNSNTTGITAASVNTGSGNAFTVLSPGIIFNKMIYAGV